MGRVRLRYFTERSVFRTELENTKSTATVVDLAEGRDVLTPVVTGRKYLLRNPADSTIESF